MNILIFLIILLVLVLVHEFGHFFTAKKFGIRVDEFGFGFPPKLFGFKKGETEYSFNLLPLGGFVKIFGENPEDLEVLPPSGGKTSKSEYSNRSLINKPKYQQAIVLFAGVFANFLLAWFLFSFGFISGLPTSVGSEPAGFKLSDVQTVIISVVSKSPADVAGLKSGDKIINIPSASIINGSKEITTQFNLPEINPEIIKSIIISNADKNIKIAYIRGKNKNINFAYVIPNKNLSDNKPMIGISMDQIGTAKLPLLAAFKEGMSLTLFVTKGTAVGLYMLIKEGIQGKGSFSSITGPIGMVGIVANAYQFGFVYLLSFMALISINLAIINLFPFPALDGGRLLFLLIEKIKGSRINPKIASTANAISFGILIFLMLIITYHDVIKLF